MDYTKSIIPILWKFLDKKKNFSLSMNIATIDGELVISIIDGARIRRFKNIGDQNFIESLSAYLRV
jgi:hypothetical protein